MRASAHQSTTALLRCCAARESTAKHLGGKPSHIISPHHTYCRITGSPRSSRCHAEALGQDWLERGRCRPVEVSEAFAVVPMALMSEMGLSRHSRQRRRLRPGVIHWRQRTRVSLITLIHALQARGKQDCHAVHRRRRGDGAGAGTFEDVAMLLTQDRNDPRRGARLCTDRTVAARRAGGQEHHFPKGRPTRTSRRIVPTASACLKSSVCQLGLCDAGLVLEEIAAGDGGTSTAISDNCPSAPSYRALRQRAAKNADWLTPLARGGCWARSA